MRKCLSGVRRVSQSGAKTPFDTRVQLENIKSLLPAERSRKATRGFARVSKQMQLFDEEQHMV